MDDLIARPHMLKQVNLSSIRKAIMTKITATRAEIARDTQISSTTVRSLLAEMLQNGEIESTGYDESSGGRKAERYQLKTDRYFAAALCILNDTIHCLVVNICGEIIQASKRKVIEGDMRTPILSFLDELTDEKDIRAIGLGVPGIVSGGGFLKGNQSHELYKDDIGDLLAKRYGIPIILENDLNATMIGLGRSFETQFPDDCPGKINMAYLFLEKGCISASFIAEGRIIRGFNNFAGELGLLSLYGQRPLSELLAESTDDSQYTDVIANIACWICAVLNPRFIALGGPGFRRDCLGPIGDALYALLPRDMAAELIYSPDILNDYYSGMAYLAAGKIFDEIQLIKE